MATAPTHRLSDKLSVFAFAAGRSAGHRRRSICRGLFDRQNPFVIASTASNFFSSGTWLVIRNLLFFFAVVFWLATLYWIYKDAKRRIEDPWVVGCRCCSASSCRSSARSSTCSSGRRSTSRTCASASSRSRRWRTASRSATCTARSAAPRSTRTFLVCPICTTKLKQACVNCKAPLEALWQVCPYCETPVEPTAVTLPQFESRRRRRAK